MSLALLSGCRLLTGDILDFGGDSSGSPGYYGPDQALQHYQDVMEQRKDYLKNVQNGSIPITYPVKN